MKAILLVGLFIASTFGSESNDLLLKDFGLGVQVESIQGPMEWQSINFCNNSAASLPQSESHASTYACPFTCYIPCGNAYQSCGLRTRRSRKCPKTLFPSNPSNGDAQNGKTPIRSDAPADIRKPLRQQEQRIVEEVANVPKKPLHREVSEVPKKPNF